MSEVIDPEILLLAREEAEERVENIEKNLLAVESGSNDPEMINELFRDAHSIDSAGAMLGWDAVASIAHSMEDRFNRCRDGEEKLMDAVPEMLISLDEMKGAVSAEVVEAAAEPRTPPTPVPPPPENGRTVAATSNGAPRPRPAQIGSVSAKPIRVSPSKVDRVLDAVGETAVNHHRLAHVLRERLSPEDSAESELELEMGNRMLSELHDSVIGMRTLPLSSITAAFPRAVRDMAVATDKEVELRMVGTDTQLDRSVLEGLPEEIHHVLRNAVAHGIESPAQREAAGKHRRGVITLRAEPRGGLIAIEIEDDGGGVPAKVLAQAEGSASLTELLCAPGFSTAGDVSNLAGRGVGLDAVKKHVDGLGGSIEVQSGPENGTKVILLLPLTLAVLRVLLCERAGQAYGVPLTSVREVVIATDTVSLGGRRALDLNGDPVDFEDLAEELGAPAPELPVGGPALIVDTADRTTALACDTVLGDEEVVLKSLGPLLSSATAYLGAAILGDGRVALILDPNQLVRGPHTPNHTNGHGATALTPIEAGPEASPPASSGEPKVLLVDDQKSVREFQGGILEDAGYSVQLACDGREALERMEESEFDIVLTDIEMPVMDGFELLGAIRGGSAPASIPVVMVTGLGTDEQKQRGAEAGADAYLVKREFDQHALLDVVSALVGA